MPTIKARLQKIETKLSPKSTPDELWKRYKALSDKLESQIGQRIPSEDKAKYDEWLGKFLWEGFEEGDDEDYGKDFYEKYATEDELKIFKQLEEISNQHRILTCTKEDLEQYYPWLDDKLIEKIYTLTKEGNLKEADSICEEIERNMTEEQLDMRLEKFL